jgi:hypothetical protein
MKHKRVIIGALVALVVIGVAAVLAVNYSKAHPAQGYLKGKLVKQSKGCKAGQACTEAAKGVTIQVYSQKGDLVGSPRTGSDGAYQVSLLPGKYVIQIDPGSKANGLAQNVTIKSSQTTEQPTLPIFP